MSFAMLPEDKPIGLDVLDRLQRVVVESLRSVAVRETLRAFDGVVRFTEDGDVVSYEVWFLFWRRYPLWCRRAFLMSDNVVFDHDENFLPREMVALMSPDLIDRVGVLLEKTEHDCSTVFYTELDENGEC